MAFALRPLPSEGSIESIKDLQVLAVGLRPGAGTTVESRTVWWPVLRAGPKLPDGRTGRCRPL